jgi:hypothetical protein
MISDLKIPAHIAERICKQYQRWGWEARLYNGYCADGPFGAILLYPKDNPRKFGKDIYGDRWPVVAKNHKIEIE